MKGDDIIMSKYHIFISHAWKYSEHYDKVVEWLNEAQCEGKLTWSNYSVPVHDPLVDPNTVVGKNKLKQELKGQIQPASKVLILAGMYAAHSDWIDYEIDTAYDMNKHIIGIKPWGQERIPSKISIYADEIVGWNKASVINALLNS